MKPINNIGKLTEDVISSRPQQRATNSQRPSLGNRKPAPQFVAISQSLSPTRKGAHGGSATASRSRYVEKAIMLANKH